MKFSEFKDKVKQAYASKFPNSACQISLGAIGKNTFFVTWYLAKDKSEVANGIANNDIFNISFHISSPELKEQLTDDTELPEKMTMEVTNKTITKKPDNQYMAYSSMRLPFRTTMSTCDKLIATLERYADITYNTLKELLEQDEVHEDHKQLVSDKLNVSKTESLTKDEDNLDEANLENIKAVLSDNGIKKERTLDLMSKDILKMLKSNYADDTMQNGLYLQPAIIDAFSNKIAQITGKKPNLSFGSKTESVEDIHYETAGSIAEEIKRCLDEKVSDKISTEIVTVDGAAGIKVTRLQKVDLISICDLIINKLKEIGVKETEYEIELIKDTLIIAIDNIQINI